MKILKLLMFCISLPASVLHAASCCAPDTAVAKEADAAPLPDTSLYQVESRWMDQTGTARSLKDYAGQPVLLVMGYLSCSTACPLLIHNTQQIISQLPPEDRLHVKPVFVSIDPAHDTVATAAKALVERGLTAEKWDILIGSPSDVRELASIVGVRYQAQEDGSVFHNNLITLVNAEGVVVAQMKSLADDPESLTAKLVSLLHPLVP